jgi:hypothetical protein
MGAKVSAQMRDDVRRSIPRSLLSVDSHPSANVTIERRRRKATKPRQAAGALNAGRLQRHHIDQQDQWPRRHEDTKKNFLSRVCKGFSSVAPFLCVFPLSP